MSSSDVGGARSAGVDDGEGSRRQALDSSDGAQRLMSVERGHGGLVSRSLCRSPGGGLGWRVGGLADWNARHGKGRETDEGRGKLVDFLRPLWICGGHRAAAVGSGRYLSPCLLPVGAGPGATLPAAGLGGRGALFLEARQPSSEPATSQQPASQHCGICSPPSNVNCLTCLNWSDGWAMGRVPDGDRDWSGGWPTRRSGAQTGRLHANASSCPRESPYQDPSRDDVIRGRREGKP